MASGGFSAGIAGALQRYSLQAEDVLKAKLCIIDSLANTFAGYSLPWSRQAIAVAGRHSGPGCSIAATGQRAATADAVFANAVLAHALVRDDMHLGSVSHLGAPIIATALTLAEETRCSGADLLRAIICGYEAGARLGRVALSTEVSRTHRPTGITGPYAAAAVTSVLLGLTESATENALNLAANNCAGNNEWAGTGGTEMFLHAGFAARDGYTGALLAQAGAEISATAVDGPAGLLACLGRSAPAAGSAYFAPAEIQAVFFKEVPACNFAQTAAQAARDLVVTEGIRSADIAGVIAHVNYASANYPGCDQAGPFSRVLQSKMSIQYNVASALLHGNFAEENYLPASNAATADLAALVEIRIDDELTAQFPARQAARIEVRLADGRRLERHARDVVPASAELVRARCQAAASAVIGASRTEQLLEMIDSLQALPRADVIAEACSVPAENS